MHQKLFEYHMSKALVGKRIPFNSLIMAAIRVGEESEALKLAEAFPELRRELAKRSYAHGGLLEEDGETIAAALEVLKEVLDIVRCEITR